MPGRKKKKRQEETEEQKQLRLEIKQLKDEESKKRKFEIVRQKLEAKLLEDQQFAKTNNLLITEKWREILSLAKSNSLVEEVMILKQNHERITDRKDNQIANLEITLAEAEEQYQLAMRSHLENLDALLSLHNLRVEQIKTEMERDLEELNHLFNTERQEILNKHKAETDEQKDIIRAMEEEFNEADAKIKDEAGNLRGEIKSANAEEFASLRIKLDSRIAFLEKEFEQANTTYTTSTEQRIMELTQMTQQDEANVQSIEINNRKLKRLQKSLNLWRTKMSNNIRECEQRNKALKEEKDSLSSHFQLLKSRMSKFREDANWKLTELSKNTHETIKELNKRMKTAEKILILADMNLKYQTEKEKVLPFYESTVHLEEEDDGIPIEEKLEKYRTTALQPSKRRIENWNFLENFYKQANKATLDNMALMAEKEGLMKENEDLKVILKRYLDGISVNEDVLNSANALFMVNGRVANPIVLTNGEEQSERAQLVMVHQYTN